MAVNTHNSQDPEVVGEVVVNNSVPEKRIGRVTRGEWFGYLVMLEKYSSSPDAWLLLWRDPSRSLDIPGALGDVAGDRLVPDAADLRNLFEEFGLEWLSDAASRDAIERYFSFPEPQRRSFWSKHREKR